MVKFSYATSAALCGLAVIFAQSAEAQIVATIDAPGVQSSQVANVTTETFDNLTPGIQAAPYVSAIGAYSAGFAVVTPDAYGGSNGTQYFSVGAQAAPTTQATLTLNGDQSYFGMFYAAGDAENQVLLYENGTLEETFNTADMVNLINATATPSAYYGNPNNGLDGGEPFAYVNFNGTNGTVFNTVVFDNSGSTGTGFESDNHSVLSNTVGLQSTPEPGALALISGFFVPAAGFVARRGRAVRK